MNVADLHHQELLEFDLEGGTIRLVGQRVLMQDATAMGLLRKYLVENFGLTAARAVLTQFGFAQGWQMAQAMQAEFTWRDEVDWRRAGLRVGNLQGLFRVEEGSDDPLAAAGAMLLASYEAEQHTLHFGRSDSAVCWTVCGLMSGYLSKVVGKEIFVLEERCLGRGHAACQIFGRTREEWGSQRAGEIGYFESGRLKESLEVSLIQVMDSLKAARHKLKATQTVLAEVAREPVEPGGIVARSQEMRRVVDLTRRVAKVDATVLITGESGVGKERFARLVHNESSRASAPFVAINCGAITETLLESELFGHVRGAFTGATADRPGLFEAANGGTLLLDEVGEVSPAMQVKLLRVLQEREVRRVGENRSRKVNVRVVAATNRDLTTSVEGETFRKDLYYRLKVVELNVPPLRERREDILPLARILLADASRRMNREITGLAPSTADLLMRYDWPGNVRELENAMERAVALAETDRVEIGDLPVEVRRQLGIPEPRHGPVRAMSEVERDYILAALAVNGGNRTVTAQQLQIGSATLYRKLKRYGADDSDLAEGLGNAGGPSNGGD